MKHENCYCHRCLDAFAQAPSTGAVASRANVGVTNQEVWFAYPHGIGGDLLRDARGVGRRFKSEGAALAAIAAAPPVVQPASPAVEVASEIPGWYVDRTVLTKDELEAAMAMGARQWEGAQRALTTGGLSHSMCVGRAVEVAALRKSDLATPPAAASSTEPASEVRVKIYCKVDPLTGALLRADKPATPTPAVAVPGSPAVEVASESEALHCPFCGSTDISDGEGLTQRPDGSTYTQSECQGCGAVGPRGDLAPGVIDYGCVAAIRAWNRRAA